MNTRLNRMIRNNLIPLADGVWIDCFNQTIDLDCTGTIIAGINSKNHYFVTDMKEPQVMSPKRTDFRIRKLTERECFRLMGVKDEDIDKIQRAGISKSQQYKMAGNSIVVNCIAAIFRQLLIGNDNKNQQLELF